jgi:negative regulator of sigma E activity
MSDLRHLRRGVGFVALAVVVAVPAVPSRAASGDDPLDGARQAAERTAFSGHVVVRWREGSVLHSQELDVKGNGGAFVAQGGRQVMGMGDERLVYSPSDGWHELWPNGLGSTRQPDIDLAYDVSRDPDGTVAGERTLVFDLSKGGTRRETLELDQDTRLLLRRRQFDARGQEQRSFEFTKVTIGDSTVTAPTVPPAPKHDGPQAVAVSSVRSSDRAPARLAIGYQRLGVFRHAGVNQFVYGDGLYDLSLFEQRGRVDSSDLPAQRRPARVDGRRAWQFSWAGGEGVVWSAGTTVYTLVGDVPPDELMLVANSVPVHRSTSITHRLRQACRGLVESFTGGR